MRHYIIKDCFGFSENAGCRLNMLVWRLEKLLFSSLLFCSVVSVRACSSVELNAIIPGAGLLPECCLRMTTNGLQHACGHGAHRDL